jgi:hypothetical protein
MIVDDKGGEREGRVGQGLLTMMMKLMIWDASVRLASLDLGR